VRLQESLRPHSRVKVRGRGVSAGGVPHHKVHPIMAAHSKERSSLFWESVRASGDHLVDHPRAPSWAARRLQPQRYGHDGLGRIPTRSWRDPGAPKNIELGLFQLTRASLVILRRAASCRLWMRHPTPRR
jgi:hypothetical protein